MHTEGRDPSDHEYVRLLAKGLVKLLIVLVGLFVAAGRLDYWQGWLLSGIVLVHASIAAILFSDRQDLVKERLKPGPGMKSWDKIFWVFFASSSVATLGVSAVDTGRYQWTSEVPVGVYVFGGLLYLVSAGIGMWAMRENRFFSSVVRIQRDRGQVVVDSGPYRFVRHPGYVGGILTFLSLPLILGSVVGLIPAAISIILLFIRTHLEDATLYQELDGYAEYTRKVRYRIVPGVW